MHIIQYYINPPRWAWIVWKLKGHLYPQWTLVSDSILARADILSPKKHWKDIFTHSGPWNHISFWLELLFLVLQSIERTSLPTVGLGISVSILAIERSITVLVVRRTVSGFKTVSYWASWDESVNRFWSYFYFSKWEADLNVWTARLKMYLHLKKHVNCTLVLCFNV